MHRLRALSVLVVAAGIPALACGGSGDADRGTPEAGAPATTAGADTAASRGAAPARGVGGSRGTVPIEIAATVAGKTYRASGNGECGHEPGGSIYERPAALWTARFSGAQGSAIEHLNLTVWRPAAGGAEEVTLALDVGSASHEIATVKGGELKGKGTATVSQDGRLTVKGEDAGGARVELDVKCARFEPIVAEGG